MTKVEPNIKYFLLIKEAKYFLVPEEIINSLLPQEAKILALQIKSKQRHQLMIDALIGDHKLNDIKVVDKLEETITKLYSLYSWLKEDVCFLENKILRLPKAQC